MHGNIKALKYALGHELIYRDPQARLDRISKPVEPYRKVGVIVVDQRGSSSNGMSDSIQLIVTPSYFLS